MEKVEKPEFLEYKTPAIIVSVILLLLGIPTGWPYGYYIILRWVVCGTAVLLAYIAFQLKKTNWVWVLGIIAFVFNPIIPIYLTKDIWVLIDLVVAIIFSTVMFTIKK